MTVEVIISVRYSFTSVMKAARKGLEEISEVVSDSDHVIRTIPTRGEKARRMREGVTVGRRG
jgi:hypothetical protein